ncbi:MAG: 5' nucleotidase, NT5C type [Flavisolibacter sp.]
MKNKKTIAIDMDGVLSDTVAQFITWYERHSGEKLDREFFHGKPENECLPDNLVRKFVYMPGFFRTAPVIQGAKEAVLELTEHFKVYIVSAAMEFPQSLAEKREWLEEHFPFISWQQIVFCGDKSIIGTDYMIDDHVKNLDYCKGKPMLFTSPHNIDIKHHKRVNDWKEVMEFFNEEKEYGKNTD